MPAFHPEVLDDAEPCIFLVRLCWLSVSKVMPVAVTTIAGSTFLPAFTASDAAVGPCDICFDTKGRDSPGPPLPCCFVTTVP